MIKPIRVAATIAGALALLVAPIALAAPAAAVPLTNVLFFSNSAYTDVPEEDATWIEGLEASGATVTVFDGGDGSAAAWTAALAGHQVFAFPEHDSDLFGVAITEEAAGVIAAWVHAGGIILASSDYDFILTSVVTGVDYTTLTDDYSGYYGPWPLVEPNATGYPEVVSDSDGTTAYDMTNWTPEQLAGAVLLYFFDDVDNADKSVVSALFPAGAGGVYYLGYDWYPGTSESDIVGRASWNALVEAILENGLPAAPAPAPAPEPQLAATGSSLDAGVWAAGAALLLLGAATVVVARRKASA